MHTPSPDRSSSSGCRRPSWRALPVTLLVAAAACAILPGCQSNPAKDKNLLRRVLPPQPVLEGSAVFEGGTLTAECWLGPTVRLKKAEPGARAGQGAPRGPEPDAMGEPFKRGGGKLSPDEINEMYGKRDYEYVLPPRSALIVKFTNHDARPVTFTIADVNSVLGNFVPSPETLTLAPAQQGAIDPMLSNFDGNFDEVELTLTLKTAGVKETHILKLQRGPESPPREGSAAP